MPDLPVLTIHTDGASRGNPGAAACAYVIASDGQLTIEVAECLGEMTNNQAEYTALVRALEHALELGPDHRLRIFSDSELMVKQMKGEYRVKNEELRDLYQQARKLCGQFRGAVTFQHVRRSQNSRADELCNEALDGTRVALPRVRQPQPAPHPTLSHPRGEGEKPEPAPTLSEQALAVLHQAAQAWTSGAAVPTAEQVWQQLAGVLQQHGVKLPG